MNNIAKSRKKYYNIITYNIELIAKQTEASFLSAQEMPELLKKGQMQAANDNSRRVK